MEDGPVDGEGRELGIAAAVERQLREHLTEGRSELESMTGADCHQHLGMAWDGIDDEVTVGRQRVQASLDARLGPDRSRKIPLAPGAYALEAVGVRLERARLGSRLEAPTSSATFTAGSPKTGKP